MLSSVKTKTVISLGRFLCGAVTEQYLNLPIEDVFVHHADV